MKFTQYFLHVKQRTDRAANKINENIYIDLDASGNLVAMTIEHARQQASLPFLSFEQIPGTSGELLGSRLE